MAMNQDDRVEEKAKNGQVIRTETAPDRGSLQTDENEALVGRKMKGGPTDLSSSLSGNNAVTYNDKK